MSKKSNFTSKNIAEKIFNFFLVGKNDLALALLSDPSLTTIRKNVLDAIEKKLSKVKLYNQTRIYSQTEVSGEVLELLSTKNIDTKTIHFEIQSDLGPGLVVRFGDTKIDATLASMLEEKIRKIATN